MAIVSNPKRVSFSCVLAVRAPPRAPTFHFHLPRRKSPHPVKAPPNRFQFSNRFSTSVHLCRVMCIIDFFIRVYFGVSCRAASPSLHFYLPRRKCKRPAERFQVSNCFSSSVPRIADVPTSSSSFYFLPWSVIVGVCGGRRLASSGRLVWCVAAGRPARQMATDRRDLLISSYDIDVKSSR